MNYPQVKEGKAERIFFLVYFSVSLGFHDTYLKELINQ